MAVLAFHSLVSVTDLSQYDLETEWRQTNQICKNNKRKTDCREIHFEKHRRKRKKHPPITISLGIIIPAFHNNCSSSSETSKYAIGVTAGLFQKHFIFEHPNKTKHVLGFAILFLPSIFLFNPSCELSNIRTNIFLHFIAVSCVLQEKTKPRKISKGSISKIRVKKLLLLILRIFWCLAVLSLPAPPAHRSH